MARQFPQIVAFGSAFRFALEAEQACGDLAAAAQVLAPGDGWQDKLDEVVCTHDDRVQKLTVAMQEAAGRGQEPVASLNGAGYLGAIDRDPAVTWPEVVEQLIRAEEDTARYLEEFVARCEGPLGSRAKAFAKAASQDRACAAELREMLG